MKCHFYLKTKANKLYISVQDDQKFVDLNFFATEIMKFYEGGVFFGVDFWV